MEENSRMDIRRLLKRFGVAADEAVIAHIARNGVTQPLKLKITLTDQTDYGQKLPAQPLYLEVDGEIRSQE